MSRPRYEPVKKGHIVPRVYQRNFAVNEQVAVHVNGKTGPVVMSIRDAGTRARFYRRTRPKDGSEIDDIEASLSYLEEATSPVLTELIGGAPLTIERKGVLAQFFGIQMVRGPAFIEERRKVIKPLVDQLSASDLEPRALKEAHGDVHRVRQKVLDSFLSSTQQLTTMLTTGMRQGSVLGSMRWQLLRFADPVVAYSDHPVVVWPARTLTVTAAFDDPQLETLTAFEAAVPLTPHLAVLMTWSDQPDAEQPVVTKEALAGQLNAFVISQADQQWMHKIGTQPPIARGPFTPLASTVLPDYSLAHAQRSARRAAASAYLHRVRKKKFLSDIEIADVKA